MSTEYTISLGYLSGQSTSLSYEDAWKALVAYVEQLRHQPERIVQEARRLNAPETCEQGCCTLQRMAEAYQLTEEECGPLVINQEDQHISQLTYGDRMLKEHIRRAFSRLILEEMHRQGIEVCLNVM